MPAFCGEDRLGQPQHGPRASDLRSHMTTASCWTIFNVSSPQGTGTIAADAHLMHSPRVFARAVAEGSGVAMRVDRRIMRLTGFLALLALIGLGGCSASGPEPSFQTAYSAVGAQLK
jgi:hypothetical protein